MNARFGMSKTKTLIVTALTTIAAASALAPASAAADPAPGRSEHWGVITRNTVGSPVAALRDGPFGKYDVQGPSARPPYGVGSLGIEVADSSVAAGDAREKVDFGNEVDFHGDPVLGLNRVGFHVFQSGENVTYGGLRNMPNIRFEIDANLSTVPVTDNYTSLVWLPPAAPVTDRWSGYINATTSGTWYLTGAEGTATGCTSLSPCSFTEVKTRLNDGGAAPVILTVAVGYGRDSMWVGAVDGLRINQNVYDFEADGVRVHRD
ncbi:hypothetical protein ACFVIL_15320 [Streptomyces sp. NPDC127159]|uniref:hypothetical protein n=1 Tax=unclassified Streptomyces TaxID=2593676 RepID=UPI003633A019